MRLIGTVEDKQRAERISAYMLTHEISTHCEQVNESWQIWIKDEDLVSQARTFLEEFRGNPDDVKYREAIDVAQKIAREKEKKLQEAKSNLVQMTSDRWNAPITKVAPFTVALIAISVIVCVFLTNLGKNADGAAFRALAFCSISSDEAVEIVQRPTSTPVEIRAEGISYDNRMRLASLAKGELWRSITPIFIHFGLWHLLFNMYWLAFFGKQIEYRYNSMWLAILVVVIAVLSNVAQSTVPAAWGGSGVANLGTHWTMLLGGMSGVIYGLFGYVWMKMTFDPKSGMHISMISVAILLIWLVACMAPNFLVSNVANWAHGIGLLTGVVIGYFPKMMADIGIGKKQP